MYSLQGYADMIADRVRMDAYSRAIRQIVKPGSVVLEIGTGPGVFAILACQAGASRVFAIESSDVIQVAREAAAANGFGDRIEFFEDISTRVNLPTKTDVVFSDLRGVLPLLEHHIPSIIDARNRFLKPGGTLCPRKDSMWAAVVESPTLYSKIMGPWEQNGLGQDLSAARTRVADTFMRARATPEQLLTEPQLWATVNYLTVESPDARGTLQWTAKRAGNGHGILVWFDAELAEGIGFSASPFGPRTIYASMFVPWIHPVQLVEGDAVCVELEANLVGDDYVWRWATQVKPSSLKGATREIFQQSMLSSLVLSPVKLRKGASDHAPFLSEEGVMARRVLQQMDGRTTIEEIARTLAAEYPAHFPRWLDAMKFAASLSQKYSL